MVIMVTFSDDNVFTLPAEKSLLEPAEHTKKAAHTLKTFIVIAHVLITPKYIILYGVKLRSKASQLHQALKWLY